jgi:hypothetical protein
MAFALGGTVDSLQQEIAITYEHDRSQESN